MIPLGIFCRASLAEHMDADYLFDITRKGFAFFEAQFGVAYRSRSTTSSSCRSSTRARWRTPDA